MVFTYGDPYDLGLQATSQKWFESSVSLTHLHLVTLMIVPFNSLPGNHSSQITCSLIRHPQVSTFAGWGLWVAKCWPAYCMTTVICHACIHFLDCKSI